MMIRKIEDMMLININKLVVGEYCLSGIINEGHYYVRNESFHETRMIKCQIATIKFG